MISLLPPQTPDPVSNVLYYKLDLPERPVALALSRWAEALRAPLRAESGPGQYCNTIYYNKSSAGLSYRAGVPEGEAYGWCGEKVGNGECVPPPDAA